MKQLELKEAANRYYYLQEYLLSFGIRVVWQEKLFTNKPLGPVWSGLNPEATICYRCKLVDAELQVIEDDGRCNKCRMSITESIKLGKHLLSQYE